MSITALTLLLGVGAFTGCSDKAADPLVVARDVTDVTTVTDATAPDEPGTTPPASFDYRIEWTASSGRVDEGTILVPLDYSDPGGATIELYVARHRASADPSAGPLLANRGGPGADGATLALDATGWFGREITDNFDVIGWDPRGTGLSEGPVDCVDDVDYDRFFSAADITPDSDDERQLLVDLAEEM